MKLIFAKGPVVGTVRKFGICPAAGQMRPLTKKEI
jgi:hypothetical protein